MVVYPSDIKYSPSCLAEAEEANATSTGLVGLTPWACCDLILEGGLPANTDWASKLPAGQDCSNAANSTGSSPSPSPSSDMVNAMDMSTSPSPALKNQTNAAAAPLTGCPVAAMGVLTVWAALLLGLMAM